jgi:hypothetical protein
VSAIAASIGPRASAGGGGATGTTVLLMHFNGADGSTTFTDSSASAHALSADGNAQIDTAESVFGGASGLFDASGDAVTASAVSSDFDFGTGGFTIEARIRFSSISANINYTIASTYDSWTLSTCAFHLLYRYNSATGDGQFRFFHVNPSSSQILTTFSMGVGNQLAANTWYAIAISCDGAGVVNGFKLFIDGAQVDSSKTLDAAGIKNATLSMRIGASRFIGSISDVHNGWIDELRITKGAGRYSASYTPATSEFTS